MKNPDNKTIHISSDWDGVIGQAPPPRETILKLLFRTFQVESAQLTPRKVNGHSLFDSASWFLHALRPLKADALTGLLYLQHFRNNSQRAVETSILSGRKKHLHRLTQQTIERTFPMVFDQVLLNDGFSSVPWKVLQTEKRLAEGKIPFHIEDDLAAALAVGQISPSVNVMLIDNISNHPWLLARNAISLPENVHRVSDYHLAVRGILQLIANQK